MMRTPALPGRAGRRTAAAALALAVTLGGCAAAPGSVSDEPLARTVVAAQSAVQQWEAVHVDLVLDASGRLSSGVSLPCFSMTSAAGDPASTDDDRFTMQVVRDASGGDSCRGDADRTTTLSYDGGTLYVTKPSSVGRSGGSGATCRQASTAHRISGELAQQLREQGSGTPVDKLLSTATAIGGTDRRVELTLDTAAVAELNTTMTLPSSVDPDDIDTTAVVEIDGAGTLTRMTFRIAADEIGSVQVDARYSRAGTEGLTTPAPSCTTPGRTLTDPSDLQSLLA